MQRVHEEWRLGSLQLISITACKPAAKPAALSNIKALVVRAQINPISGKSERLAIVYVDG